MKAVCPNNKEHKRFITVAHISQEWVVDENGNFEEIATECIETVASPDAGNTWNCAICKAEALLGTMTLDEAIDEVINDCKKEWEDWTLDERDSDIDVSDLLETNLNRDMHPNELQSNEIQTLIKWAADVCEKGKGLAYQYRINNPDINHHCLAWHDAKNSDPEF